MSYDGENRLTGYDNAIASLEERGTYFYDGLGRRVKRTRRMRGTSETTTYVYDAFGRLAAEYASVAPAAGRGGKFFRTEDHLGSTRVVTRQERTVVECADYFPYGERIGRGLNGRSHACYGGTGGVFAQQFTGKERDAESSLDYFGARHYSARLGRFTGPDAPLVDQFASDAQSWNLYAYARNNPLRFLDPTGNACVVREDGSTFDDDSGGQSCAEVAAQDKNLKPTTTVRAPSGSELSALVLNTFFAVDSVANDYFAFLTAAIGVRPATMQNIPVNEGVTGQIAAAGVFVGTTFNPRGLLMNTRTRLLQTARNQKLKNIITNLYRPNAQVGRGSTADALRFEIQTGVPIGGKNHFMKGIEYRNALLKLWRSRSLSSSDRTIVKELLTDIQDAVSRR